MKFFKKIFYVKKNSSEKFDGNAIIYHREKFKVLKQCYLDLGAK